MLKPKRTIYLTLVCSLLPFSCSSPESDQPILTGEFPLHLEEHIDDARIEGSKVPEDIAVPVEWNFSEPQPDWKATIPRPFPAGIRPATVSVMDDALHITLDSSNANPDGTLVGGAFINIPEWNHWDWAHVAIEARSSGQGNIELGFNIWEREGHPDEGWPYPYEMNGARGTSLINDGEVHTYELPLEPSESWENPIRQLGFWLMTYDSLEIDILSIAVVPLEALYAEEYLDAPVGVRTSNRNEEHKRTIYTHAPGRIEYCVQIPQQGRLDVGLGVLREDVWVKFRIVASHTKEQQVTLFEEEYGNPNAWGQRSVDLSSMAEKTVRIALETEAARLGTVALWAAPTLTATYLTQKTRNNSAEILDELVGRIENGEFGEMHSVLIARYGELIFEKYFNGYSKERKQNAASVTKSFISALVGIAIDKGYIKNVEDKVLDFFPEYMDEISKSANFNPAKKEISIRHLLTMSSGFLWDEFSYPYGHPENSLSKMHKSPNDVKYVLDLPMNHSPGEHFAYSSGSSHLLSVIVEKAVGERTRDFAQKHLFGPLGIENYSWLSTPKAETPGWWGLQLRPIDMLKFGQLYLNKGRWNGKQVVSERWINESSLPHKSVDFFVDYGYQHWVYKQNYAGQYSALNKSGPGAYLARGRGGQRIIVIPKFEVVVVLTGYNLGIKGANISDSVLFHFIYPALASMQTE